MSCQKSDHFVNCDGLSYASNFCTVVFKLPAGNIVAKFEDWHLGLSIARVFDATITKASIVADIRVLSVISPYDVFLRARRIAAKVDATDVVGIVDVLLEERLRNDLQPDVCAVHACGIKVNDHAVALAGISGSGKTTLGLAAAMAGFGFLGDEFGYLDTISGEYWHARYPVATKSGAAKILGLPQLDEGLKLCSAFGVEAKMISQSELLQSLNSEDLAEIRLPLAAFVLPIRDPSCNIVRVEQVSVAYWPQTIMRSLDWMDERVKLFRSLFSLASKKCMKVLALHYSKPNEAVKALSEGPGILEL